MEIGDRIFWEDDGIGGTSSPAPVYVEEEQIQNDQSSGNDDVGIPAIGDDDQPVVLGGIIGLTDHDADMGLTGSVTINGTAFSLDGKSANDLIAWINDDVEGVAGVTADLALVDGDTIITLTSNTVDIVITDGGGIFANGTTELDLDVTTNFVEQDFATEITGTYADKDAVFWLDADMLDTLAEADGLTSRGANLVYTISEDTLPLVGEFGGEVTASLSLADGATFTIRIDHDGDGVIEPSVVGTADLIPAGDDAATATLDAAADDTITINEGTAIDLNSLSTVANLLGALNALQGIEASIDGNDRLVLTSDEPINIELGGGAGSLLGLAEGTYVPEVVTFVASSGDDLQDLMDYFNASDLVTISLVDGTGSDPDTLQILSESGNAVTLEGFSALFADPSQLETGTYAVRSFGLTASVLSVTGTLNGSVEAGTDISGLSDDFVIQIDVDGGGTIGDEESITFTPTTDSTVQDLLDAINGSGIATAMLTSDGKIVIESISGVEMTLAGFGQISDLESTEPYALDENHRDVFTWDLREDGASRFEVIDQLDHDAPGAGLLADENLLNIDLSVLLNGADGDGDLLDLSGTNLGTFNVIDDIPVATGLVSAVEVDEDGLDTAEAPDPNPDGEIDLVDGTGTNDGADAAGESTTGGNSLNDLVSVGTDEFATYSLDSDTSSLPILYSGGVQLVYQVTDGTTLTATAGGLTVFTLTIDPTYGTWDFDLDGELDHVAPVVERTGTEDLGGAGEALGSTDGVLIVNGTEIDLSVLPTVQALLDAIDLVSGVDAGLDDAGALVVTSTVPLNLALEGDAATVLGLSGGTWYPSDENLDLVSGELKDGSVDAIDFSALILATDFDGDTIALPEGTFTVAVRDDVPEQVTATDLPTVDEDGLDAGNEDDDRSGEIDYGGETQATGDLSGLVTVGADVPATFSLNPDTSYLESQNLTSRQAALVYSISGGTLTASVVSYSGDLTDSVSAPDDTLADGASFVISVDLDGSGDLAGDEVFTFEVSGTDTTLQDLVDAINGHSVGGDPIVTATITGGNLVLESITGLPMTISGFEAVYSGAVPSEITSTRTVFTYQLGTDGAYTFDLLGQLDHTGDGDEDFLTIDLTGMVFVTDFDGDTIALDNSHAEAGETVAVGIKVGDDIPIQLTGSSTVIVDEDALGNQTGDESANDGDDLSLGNIDDTRLGENDFTPSVDRVVGDVSGLVSAGADEEAVFSLAASTSYLEGQELTSKGAALVYDVSGGTLTASVLSVSATIATTPGSTLADDTYSFDIDTNTFTFVADGDDTLQDLIDEINGSGYASAALDGDTLVIESLDGEEAITFTGGFDQLNGALTGEKTTTRTVFTYSLAAWGAFVFDLEDQLDHSVEGETDNEADDLTIDMTGMIQVTDRDGDTITLSNEASDADVAVAIVVKDDVPILQVDNLTGTGTVNPQIGLWGGSIGADELGTFEVKVTGYTVGTGENQYVADGIDMSLGTYELGPDGDIVFHGVLDLDGVAGGETAAFDLTFRSDGTYVFNLAGGFSSTFEFSTANGSLPAGDPDPVQTLPIEDPDNPGPIIDYTVFFAVDPTSTAAEVNTALDADTDYATFEGTLEGLAGTTGYEIIGPDWLMNVSSSGIGVGNNVLQGAVLDDGADGETATPDFGADDESFVVNPETPFTSMTVYVDNSVGGFDAPVEGGSLDGKELLYYRVFFTDGTASDYQLVYDGDLEGGGPGQQSYFYIDIDDYSPDAGVYIEAVQLTMDAGAIKIPVIEFAQEIVDVADSLEINLTASMTDADFDTIISDFVISALTDDNPEAETTDLTLTGTAAAESFNIDLTYGIEAWTIDGFLDETDTITLLNAPEHYTIEDSGSDAVIRVGTTTTITVTDAAGLITSDDIRLAYSDQVVDDIVDTAPLNGDEGLTTQLRDAIISLSGADTSTGGDDADMFVFFSLADAGDSTDFDSAEGDAFVISASGFGVALAEGPLDPTAFTSGTSPTAGPGQYFLYDTDDDQLLFDPDANGSETPILLASWDSGSALTASDILIIA